MFSVLGRREVAGRSGTTLEGEAGVNDPAGIALMLGMIELATHEDASFIVVVREFAVEMSIGVALGLVGALVLLPVLRNLRLPSEGSYPVFALVLAGCIVWPDLPRPWLRVSRRFHRGPVPGRCPDAL